MVSVVGVIEILLLIGLVGCGFLVSLPVGGMALCAAGLYELTGVRR